jgi:hypothetical protein
MVRPSKSLRLNYWQLTPEFGACIGVLGGPNEVLLQASQKAFISVKEDVVSISGGFPSKINIQGMSDSFRYAGMLQDLPFPLTLIPSTLATPLPKQLFVPPFMGLLPQLSQLGAIASIIL